MNDILIERSTTCVEDNEYLLLDSVLESALSHPSMQSDAINFLVEGLHTSAMCQLHL